MFLCCKHRTPLKNTLCDNDLVLCWENLFLFWFAFSSHVLETPHPYLPGRGADRKTNSGERLSLSWMPTTKLFSALWARKINARRAPLMVCYRCVVWSCAAAAVNKAIWLRTLMWRAIAASSQFRTRWFNFYARKPTLGKLIIWGADRMARFPSPQHAGVSWFLASTVRLGMGKVPVDFCGLLLWNYHGGNLDWTAGMLNEFRKLPLISGWNKKNHCH